MQTKQSHLLLVTNLVLNLLLAVILASDMPSGPVAVSHSLQQRWAISMVRYWIVAYWIRYIGTQIHIGLEETRFSISDPIGVDKILQSRMYTVDPRCNGSVRWPNTIRYTEDSTMRMPLSTGIFKINRPKAAKKYGTW
jgi:hypothetical protein